MTTTAVPPRFDEREIGAGTAMRFALLVVLLLVSSGAMMSQITGQLYETDYLNAAGCYWAAGYDVPFTAQNPGADPAVQQALGVCLARYAPGPPWWLVFVGPVAVLFAAAGLFRVLPVVRTRRGRLVALGTVDRDGAIRQTLDELEAAAGVGRVERVFVDPTAFSAGAVVFGSTRRPVLCLHAGLLAGRSEDPARFRAVLLHELAHVRNRDITVTYTAVAMWRVFVALVLVPYLVLYAILVPASVRAQYFSAEVPFAVRALALPVLLTVVVYLARADVLRTREIYADLAAQRWDADLSGWQVAESQPPGGRLKRGLASFAQLWRVHPRWDLRLRAHADPAPLFPVMALPMFLTGVAAALITDQTQSYLGTLSHQGLWDSAWAGRIESTLAAVAVTGVAGVAIWRSVAHAVLTQSPRVPSGLRAGLWLGAGMVVGELDMNQMMVDSWLPSRAEVLGVVIVAGALLAWWTAQCSHLWVRAVPGRARRWAMLLIMAAGCLLWTAWFSWLRLDGARLAFGQVDMTAGLRTLEAMFPGPVGTHHGMLYGIEAWLQVFSGLYDPVVLAALAALIIVPLLAWAAGSATGVTRRPIEAADGPTQRQPQSAGAVPPLRDVLLPAGVGAVACWAAVALVKAYMHTWQPPLQQRWGPYVLVLDAWVVLAVAAVSAAAGVAASTRMRRYRLVITVVAAEVCALIGLLGYFVQMSSDGCIQPTSTLASRCHWLPAGAWPLLEVVLGPVLGTTAILAAAAAVIASAVHSIRGAGRPQQAPARPDERRREARLRRAGVSLLCAVVAAATATAATFEGSPGGQADRTDASLNPPQGRPSASGISRLQMQAWQTYGGQDLLLRYYRASGQLLDIMQRDPNAIHQSDVDPVCSEMGQLAQEAKRYFPVPDPQADTLWNAFIRQAQNGSRDCLLSFPRSDQNLFTTSIYELSDAERNVGKLSQRITTVRQAPDSHA